MARKRKTQKKEETSEEATPKKATTTKKSSSKIKLTYAPLGFGAQVMSFPLKMMEYQEIDGVSIEVNEDLLNNKFVIFSNAYQE